MRCGRHQITLASCYLCDCAACPRTRLAERLLRRQNTAAAAVAPVRRWAARQRLRADDDDDRDDGAQVAEAGPADACRQRPPILAAGSAGDALVVSDFLQQIIQFLLKLGASWIITCNSYNKPPMDSDAQLASAGQGNLVSGLSSELASTSLLTGLQVSTVQRLCLPTPRLTDRQRDS